MLPHRSAVVHCESLQNTAPPPSCVLQNPRVGPLKRLSDRVSASLSALFLRSDSSHVPVSSRMFSNLSGLQFEARGRELRESTEKAWGEFDASARSCQTVILIERLVFYCRTTSASTIQKDVLPYALC